MRNQYDCAFVYTICLAGFLVGASGCGEKPAPVEEPSAASSVALPVASSSPAVSDEDETAVKTPYRIRVVYSGKSTVEFSVFVNGTQIGSYNSGSESDLTPSLAPGKNAIKVVWTADPNMKSYESARLFIETNQEEKWNTVLSREVRKETAAGETTLNLDINGPGTAPAETSELSSASPSIEPSATASVMSPEVSPSAVSSSSPSAVSTRYSIKVDVHEYSPANFSLALNGTTIGDFTSDANQDITQDVRPGKNVLSITWKHTGPVTNKFSQSKVVLGAERNGTWSTVANQGVGINTKDGSRTITFIAK
jgi:hypothetical protein